MAQSVLVATTGSEPVTVAELKAHSRVTSNAEDALCSDYITAARQWCEAYANRVFVQSTWDIYFDYGFPCGVLEIPKSPLISITSVQYVDASAADMTPTTLSASEYQVSTSEIVGRISPAYGKVWPTPKPVMDAVIVRAVCGYTSLPKNFKSAVYLLAAHLYQNREGILVGSGVDAKEVPLGVKSLLTGGKLFKV